jgi:hypothetical protein
MKKEEFYGMLLCIGVLVIGFLVCAWMWRLWCIAGAVIHFLSK